MEERLKNLRQSFKKSAFKGLAFTEEHKAMVHREIKQEEILKATLQLLSQERTGIEVLQALRARGVTNFENHEGFLYTLLHKLEHQQYIKSRWDEQEIKYYQIHDKGKKLLLQLNQKQTHSSSALKALLGGA
ncbi:MAG: PadR family transcriptional regulator [Bacillus sp. (in: firmicutes)]